MQPQITQASIASNPTSLDPQAVNLAKAIRQTESGGNFQAKGKSGEYGAYQFTQPTWDTYAKKYGVNVPLEQATPEQQNEVAYKQIKEWKDAGRNVGEIASLWNSGKPDAYLDTNYKGKNKYGVNYDVPAYAKSVATAYQAIKNGQQVGVDPQNPSSTTNVQSPEAPQAPHKDLLQKVGDVVNTIFPGKQVGEAIGTLGGYLASPHKDTYDTSAPSPLQVAGDVAQGALMVGTGQPEGVEALNVFGKSVPVLQGAETALGRIGQTGLIGAGFGATNALKEGKTNVKDIAIQSAVGGATGAALGGVGELISKAAQSLPQSIVRKFVPGINEKTAAYAVGKGLASPGKMLEESNKSISELGSKLGGLLEDPKYAGVEVDGKQLLSKLVDKYKDSGLAVEDIAREIKKLVPLKKNLVDKLMNGSISLKELHELNSALGSNTFKTVFDDPAVKAGKEIGSSVYHTVSDFLKTTIPDSAPVFDELSKEYQLNSALKQVIRRAEKSRFFTLRDLVALMSGLSAGGPVGAGGAFLAEKALVNPTVNLKTAGLISKLGGKTAQQLGKGLVKPALNVLTK